MKGNEYEETFCPLSTLDVYPYLVKTFSYYSDAFKTVRHGVLLSHRAVLTTIRGFIGIPKKYLKVWASRVIAKKVGTETRSSDICYQNRKVQEMIRHPRFRYQHVRTQKFWDLQVFVLDKAFHAEREFAYPVIPLSKHPFELWQLIRTLQGTYEVAGCEMPYYGVSNTQWPLRDYRAESEVVHATSDGCSKAVCYNDQHWHVEECLEDKQNSLDNTFLCVLTKWRLRYPSTHFQIPELGSPLICNNTGIGLGTDAFKQRTFVINVGGSVERPDLIMVATFIRMWPWILEMKHTYWDKFYHHPDKWDSPYLQHNLWQKHIFTTPRWDKNVSKELRRFHLQLAKNRQPQSDGDRIYPTYTTVSLIAVQATLILFIWVI
ncbi:hypothetical protein GE061_007518 [Apolygus lucorum]|uniref:Peptidase S1 domain-containing protein n=1 Tax=Apolygus lucorum TaxID=248454 RepID=A0A6A4IWX1_APOLU|nr:hypothetical protein GE061_007518 [Apolygus lucorum]